MRKALHIGMRVLAVLVLLLLAGLVAIQSPRVQTWLGRKVLEKVQAQLDARISVGAVSVQPFEAITLSEVLVMDTQPFVEQMDTLLHAGALSAKFSLGSLLGGGAAYLSHVRLENGHMQLVIEPDSLDSNGSRTNLQRMFRIPEEDPDKEKKGWGNLLSAREVVVRNFRFQMANPPAAARMAARGIEPWGPGTIDWNDLDATLLYARAHNLHVEDSRITASVDSLSLQENKTGFHVSRARAAKVSVGKERLRINHLELQDRYSKLLLNRLQLDGALQDYDDFENKIRLTADVREGTEVSMKTVSYFGPHMEKFTFRGRLKGRAEGYLNDFALRKIQVDGLDHAVHLEADGRLLGITDIETSLFDIDIHKLDFSLNGLSGFVKSWAPQVKLDLRKMAPGARFSFTGKAKGPLNRLAVCGRAVSGIGGAKADVTLRNIVDSKRPIQIAGTLETADLDLGRFTGMEQLGPLSLKTGLSASLQEGGPQVHIDSLKISRLNAMGYDYTNLSAAGDYTGDAFDGRIIAADPNLNFLFQGLFNLSKNTRNAAYRFYASLGYADLHALHLDSRPQSKLRLQASSNFIWTESRDLLGDITITDISLESASGRHDIGDISVKAHANDDVHRIRLKSDFINGSYVGDKAVFSLIGDLRSLTLDRELGALTARHAAPWDGATYEVNLNVNDAGDLLDFLAPGVYVANPSRLNLKVGPDGTVNAKVESGRIAYNDKFVKDLKFSLDNAGDALRASVTATAVQLGQGTQLRENRVALFADDNHLGVGYAFDNNEQSSDTRAEVYLSASLDRDKEGLSVKAQALPSNIYYKGAGWSLHSGEILYKGGDLRVDHLQAVHEDERLDLDGGFSPTRSDTLHVRMEKFNMALLNTFAGSLPELAGFISGNAKVISPKTPSYGLEAGLVCDSTLVAGKRLGRLNLESAWSEADNRFLFSARNDLDGKHNLDAEGYLIPEGQLFHAQARLDSLNLGYAAPLLASVFSTFGGALSGDLTVDGPLKDLHVSSRGLRLADGLLALDFTRALYHVDGELDLDEQALRFTDVRVRDDEDGTGQVTGSIGLGGFRELSLDTHVRFNRMLALNLPKGVNPSLFGTIYADGKVDITGPLNRLLVDVDATTVKQGNLHLPLGSSSGERERDLLVFKEPEEDLQTDSYELMMAAGNKRTEKASNLTVKLTARATPDVTAYIDIGEENSLNAIGAGTIGLEMESAQHSFGLSGNYTLSEGSFHFSAMNLVSRDFTIQDGSSVRFNGAVMDTDLNVKGLYVTKANLSNLITTSSDTESAGAGNRRTVNCGIDITGKLRNPELTFSIDVPDLNPATQLDVQRALNTEDKIQKQFLYLLIAGSFLPPEESGITSNGSEMLFSNVSSIMSGQINNIFEKLNIPLDLGLNYQTTQGGKNMFDVAVSTQLFNNRVVVNGTVGNKQVMGTTTNEIAGDVDIGIKLNKTGELRLTLFSHSADQFSTYLDNSQRNGAGITYQREFYSFGQFFRTLFAPRRRREERRLQDDIPQTVLQIDSLGHASLLRHE